MPSNETSVENGMESESGFEIKLTKNNIIFHIEHLPCWTVFLSIQLTTVTFADYYLRANIEFRNKACTHGKYYSYTGVYFL